MGGKSRRVTSIYVIDTSYLLEIYRVPGHSSQSFHKAVKVRLRKAVEAEARLYAPFPVIFELANHIAHVTDGTRRIALAKKLSEDIRSSAKSGIPWVITAQGPRQSVLLELSSLLKLTQDFETTYAAQGLGLSDIAVTKQAETLARRYPKFAVHIWTTDRGLKAREPQAEPHPLVVLD